MPAWESGWRFNPVQHQFVVPVSPISCAQMELHRHKSWEAKFEALTESLSVSQKQEVIYQPGRKQYLSRLFSACVETWIL